MSTEKIGSKLRQLREERGLPLRKVASFLDIDIAILSKMERGERKLTKIIIQQLAQVYKYDENELMVLFLSDKIVYELENEDLCIAALKAAEEKIKYQRKKRGTK
jgi:transcriptional regulator with XRE-family HTH domain